MTDQQAGWAIEWYQTQSGERPMAQFLAGLDSRQVHSEGITTMASKAQRKSTQRDDLDRWLEAEYQADPGMEQRVERLMREMEIDMGLTALRKARGLSQDELAKRIGVTQPAVAKIESGRVKNLELKTLVKYVAALGGRVKIEILPRRSGGRRSVHGVK